MKAMRRQEEDDRFISGSGLSGTGYSRARGAGPGSAGQSGDTQGLSDDEEAGSESVAELVEEGQFFEAEIIAGIENTPDADAEEIYTHEVPEDDVPGEYLGLDQA